MTPKLTNYSVSLIEPLERLVDMPHGLTAGDDTKPWLWLPEDWHAHPGSRLTNVEALNELQPDFIAGFYRLFAPSRQLPARLWNGEQLPGSTLAFSVVLEDSLLPAIPTIKSAAAFDGERLVLLRPDQLVAFVRLHQSCTWLCHRAGLVYVALDRHLRRCDETISVIARAALDRRLHDVRILDWLCRQPLPDGHFGLLRSLPALAREALLRAEPGSTAACQIGALFQFNRREAQATPWGFVAAEAVAVFYAHHGLQDELARKGLPFGLQDKLKDDVEWDGILTAACVGQYEMFLHGVPLRQDGWQEYERGLNHESDRCLSATWNGSQALQLLRCVRLKDGTDSIRPDDIAIRRYLGEDERPQQHLLYRRSEIGFFNASLLAATDFKPEEPLGSLVELLRLMVRRDNLRSFAPDTINARAPMLTTVDPLDILHREQPARLELPPSGQLLVVTANWGALASHPHLTNWLLRMVAARLPQLGFPCYGIMHDRIVFPLRHGGVLEDYRPWLEDSGRLLGTLLKNLPPIELMLTSCTAWDHVVPTVDAAQQRATEEEEHHAD